MDVVEGGAECRGKAVVEGELLAEDGGGWVVGDGAVEDEGKAAELMKEADEEGLFAREAEGFGHGSRGVSDGGGVGGEAGEAGVLLPAAEVQLAGGGKGFEEEDGGEAGDAVAETCGAFGRVGELFGDEAEEVQQSTGVCLEEVRGRGEIEGGPLAQEIEAKQGGGEDGHGREIGGGCAGHVRGWLGLGEERGGLHALA